MYLVPPAQGTWSCQYMRGASFLVSVVLVATMTTSVASAEPNYAPPGMTPAIRHEDDVSEIQQLTGPPTAFFFGFGMGHVVEGRWKERGWIFTLGETAGVALMMTNFMYGMSCEDRGCVYGGDTGDAITFATMLGVTGLRVWETVDSVTGARAKNRRVMRQRMQRMQIAPLVLPARTGDGAMAGVALRF